MIKTTVSQIRNLALAGCVLMATLVFVDPVAAQGWERTFGANSEDYGEAITATSDWGALVVGYSESFGSDNDLDVYVVRLDVDGQVLWTNFYDEAYEERAYDVLETEDGGFLIAGYIINTPGEKANAYLLKINADGTKEWSRQYGSQDAVETLSSLSAAVDEGFVLTGYAIASDTGNTDVLLIKVAADGQLLWSKTYGGPLNDEGMDVAPYKGGYALAGVTDNQNEAVGKDILLYRLDADGDTIWTKSTATADASEEAGGLIVTQDGGIVVAGQITSTSLMAYLAKYDENGAELWKREIGPNQEDAFVGVVELANGHLVAGGFSSIDEVNVDFLIAEFDANGQTIWVNNQGGSDTYEAAESIAASPDGGFLLVGYNGQLSGLFNDMIAMKTDELGNKFSNTIRGKVYFDRDGLCDEDINDDPIEGWLVKVEGSGKIYFATSDAEGHYEVTVDAGAYNVSVLLPTNLWNTCVPAGYDITFSGLYESAELDFPVSVEQECPYLEVNVSALTPLLCMQDDYILEYRNAGTAAAQNVRLEVTVDESLTVDAATASYEMINGKLVFMLGNLLPFQGGKIRLTVSNCEVDQIVEQEALMVRAEIISDVFCFNAGPEWDGSSVEVTGTCNQDSISFTITNTGDSDMTEYKQYGVVEDIVLIKQDSFRLESGQRIRVFWDRANGSTYRIIAQQVKDHPGLQFPTFALEGCVTEEGQTFSTGFVTMFPENDRDAHISIDVQEAVAGPLPEVEMKGFPKGYDDDRLIANTTDLTYKISFVNQGTDTIHRVAIRDTLPPELDVTTVIPGASSHPYTFEVYDQGIVRITFADIELLPGGGASSGGFVNFKVSQKPGNPDGTVIQNRAAIFLGYRPPVQTNTVFHEVGNFPDFLLVNDIDNKTFVPGVKIKVSPNPFIESTVFEIEGQQYNDLMISLYDLQGRLLRRERRNGNRFEIYRENLTAGLYLYTISSREQMISAGKILVQ